MLPYPAVTTVSANAANVRFRQRRASREIMGNASKGVAVCIPHVPIPAQQNATGTLRVRHARRPVTSNVATPDVLKNVPSHVPLVQYHNACLRVRIARVPCLAPRRVITFHALDDVRNLYHAATNARPYVDISVDFILGQTYKEIDLDENPCIFPPCGHFLTVENMDAQMDLGKHYVIDEMGKPSSISKSSEPFSISDVRNCATCRGSLRSISRYGRLVRRALLDEATKKFILYVNQKYVPMARELTQLVAQLPDNDGTATAKAFQTELTLKVQGPPDHQIRLMHQHLKKHDSARWKDLIALRQQVTEYYKKVKVEEQPFNQVRNMVEDARRRKRKTGQFEFDENVLQTKGCVQAASLLLRLDTALIGDFLSLYKQTPSGSNKCVLHLDLQANRKEGENLTAMAVNSQRVLHQVEGYLFRAQLCALERQSSDQPTRAEDLLNEGNECIERAQKLCTAHPGQVRGLADEIEGTLKMLRGGTFYTPVTSEERMAVVAAMAGEFRGTGHWYRCENNHPFTIGECGGAMEISTCPECGARVGGQGHRTVAGVTRADDLEVNMARLMI
ncbi:hypothetical protein OAory_01047180 [Aspergillus oryzae]|uniref:RZ-type domain-containing protein n=1 Tax=Aspergillus oryzae TaxID=5062 RepID=A0A1S9DGM0_ASPOZ|nr:hypothetical protein OAory_01047180 [Aspergillus oryzae]